MIYNISNLWAGFFSFYKNIFHFPFINKRCPRCLRFYCGRRITTPLSLSLFLMNSNSISPTNTSCDVYADSAGIRLQQNYLRLCSLRTAGKGRIVLPIQLNMPTVILGVTVFVQLSTIDERL